MTSRAAMTKLTFRNQYDDFAIRGTGAYFFILVYTELSFLFAVRNVGMRAAD